MAFSDTTGRTESDQNTSDCYSQCWGAVCGNKIVPLLLLKFYTYKHYSHKVRDIELSGEMYREYKTFMLQRYYIMKVWDLIRSMEL